MLNHVQQPTADTCVSACLAMLLNKPVQNVINAFHEAYHHDSMRVNEFTYLSGLGLPVQKCYTLEELDDEYVYMLGVPSLNIPGIMHSVVLYFQDWDYCGEEPDIVVLDPNKGKEGKKWYHFDLRQDYTEQGGHQLQCYAPSIKISKKTLVEFLLK